VLKDALYKLRFIKEISFNEKNKLSIKKKNTKEKIKVVIEIQSTTILRYLIITKFDLSWNILLLNSPILFFTIKSLSKEEWDWERDELS
jgi:hypothetical protein